jgi:site-specific recombinase XerD
MNTNLAIVPKAEIVEVGKSVKKYAEAAKSENTQRAYSCDIAHFEDFCEFAGLCPLPATPKIVRDYLSDLADAGYRMSTLERRMASISQWHKLSGYKSPINDAVREVVKGIKNTKLENGEPIQDHKKPFAIEHIISMITEAGKEKNRIIGIRNATMFLLAFSGFLRCSELVELKLKDIDSVEGKIEVMIRKSKTNKTGKPDVIGIKPQLIYNSLQQWIREGGIVGGYLFRAITKDGKVLDKGMSPTAFWQLVKKYCLLCGFDSSEYSPHSFRHGGATQAWKNGTQETAIKKHGRWKSRTYQDYLSPDVFSENNPSGNLGL